MAPAEVHLDGPDEVVKQQLDEGDDQLHQQHPHDDRQVDINRDGSVGQEVDEALIDHHQQHHHHHPHATHHPDPNGNIDNATDHDYQTEGETQADVDDGQQHQHYTTHHQEGVQPSEQQEEIYHQDHQQYQDHQHHDTHHQHPNHQHHLVQVTEDGLVDGQEQEHLHHQQDVGQIDEQDVVNDESRHANPFDFLPFYPDAAGDMTRLAEAWQQSQQQLQAHAAAAAAAAAAATQQHGGHQQLDENGNLIEGSGMGDDQQAAMEQYTGEHNGQDDQDGKVEQVVDAGDAGLLLGMAAESNNQAAAQQQQVHNAIAAYSAATPNGGYSATGSYDSPNPARDAAAAAAAAAAASSGVNPAYAIAAALAAQSQRNGQGWDYAQLTSHLEAAAAANPYSNPNYQTDIAAYNQQQNADGTTSTSDQPMPKAKVRGSRAPGTVPNTIGGHTHRPGSGHAFCSGPVVEGTNYKRFVFPCPPTVSAGRQKHVQSAQEMADTYPLAEHPCDRCTGYDNPLPCFHVVGNKCVYCKFLSKPCSLQPGGSNSKGLRRSGEEEVGKPKKKRKTDAEGYVDGVDTIDAVGGAATTTGGEEGDEGADASAYLEEHHHHQQEVDGGLEEQQYVAESEGEQQQLTEDVQQMGQGEEHHHQELIQEDFVGQGDAHQQLGHEQEQGQQDLTEEEMQAQQVAHQLAAVAAAQQQHEEELQAQAAQAIQQAQAQAEAMDRAEMEAQQQQHQHQGLDGEGYQQQEQDHQQQLEAYEDKGMGSLVAHELLNGHADPEEIGGVLRGDGQMQGEELVQQGQ